MERYRKAAITSLMSLFSQFVQIATGLISVPLALNYLGVEQFGIWMTLSTALAFITFADLGIGIGVQDRMSRFIGANLYELACKTFFSSIAFVFVLFCLLMVVNLLLVPIFNLASLLAIKSDEAIAEIVPTAQMVILVLGLGLLSGIVQRAFNSLQEGFLVAAIQVVLRICSLILLFVVVNLKLGLPALVFVVGGLSSVGILLIGLPLLLIRHKWLVPVKLVMSEIFDRECLKDVMKIGILGFGASISIYLVNNSALILISGKYGVESVADYSVLLKLLSIPTLLLTYLLIPLWPAIAEAKVKNDKKWIQDVYKKCSSITIVVTVVSSFVFLLFGRQIIQLWTQNAAVVPGFRLLMASIAFMALGFWNTLTTVILNGLSMYRSQATYGVLFAAVFIIFAAIIPVTYGKDFIVWIIGIGYLARCIIMHFEVRRCLHVSEKNKMQISDVV